MDYTRLSDIIKPFPHIREFGRMDFNRITRGSLNLHYNDGIEICYIIKGRYLWEVEGRQYMLYPGDAFVTCPWQIHGSPNGVMDLGLLSWIILNPQQFAPDGSLTLGDWSPLSPAEERCVGEILSNNKYSLFRQQRIGDILAELFGELRECCSGYKTRINNLIIDLLLFTVRNVQHQMATEKNAQEDFERLRKTIISDLTQNWTVDEMAAIIGLGTTAFNEKMKKITGYTPNHYLIHLRIEKAKQLLTETTQNLTWIALECGFYSSQHFSDTFKRWEGITPREYRKQKHLHTRQTLDSDKRDTHPD